VGENVMFHSKIFKCREETNFITKTDKIITLDLRCKQDSVKMDLKQAGVWAWIQFI
jgi:hypothetical protein